MQGRLNGGEEPELGPPLAPWQGVAGGGGVEEEAKVGVGKI